MHRTNRSGRIIWGFVLILLGVIFLLQNLGLWDAGEIIRRFWPVIFILLGLKMLLEHSGRSHRETNRGFDFDEDDSRKVSGKYHSAFGDIRKRFDGRTVGKTHFSSVLGDMELDFSRAKFEENTSLQVNGVLGDVEIRLPADVKVDVHANSLAGSIRIFDEYQSGFFKNVQHSHPDTEQKKPLKLHVSVLLGDIKVYSE